MALGYGRTLIKRNDEIHTVTNEGSILSYPLFGESLTENDFNLWGIADLTKYENEMTAIELEMQEIEALDTGKVSKQTVDKSKHSISKLTVR